MRLRTAFPGLFSLIFAIACSDSDADGGAETGGAGGASSSGANGTGGGGEPSSSSSSTGATSSGGQAQGGAGGGGGVIDPYNDQPQDLTFEAEELEAGWYQYYQGSVQYRPSGDIFDIAVSAENAPFVFHESQNPGLRLRYKDDGSWLVDDEVADPKIGYIPNAVRVSVDGELAQVAIAGLHYVDYPNFVGSLHHYRYDGYKWFDEHPTPGTTINFTPRAVAHRLDAAGRAHVAFVGRPPPGNNGTVGLIYARWDGSTWIGETVDTAVIAPGENAIELELGPDGEPRVAFLAENPDSGPSESDYIARVATRSAGTWNVETAEDYLYLRPLLAMGLAPDGSVHLALADDENGDLFHVANDGGSWEREVVDDEGDIAWGFALEVDGLGRPHLSHVDRETNQIRYARKLASGWDKYALPEVYADTAGASGGTTELETRIAVDAEFLPHIAIGGFDLSYVHGERP
jgi:hypothetical protein